MIDDHAEAESELKKVFICEIFHFITYKPITKLHEILKTLYE
jgi:hypothetical protein